MSIHRPPSMMTNTDQFFIRICDCGVVHMSFGPAMINATSETVIAISETLKDVSVELRKRLSYQNPIVSEPTVLDPSDNVVTGRFPTPIR